MESIFVYVLFLFLFFFGQAYINHVTFLNNERKSVTFSVYMIK